ncbi:MAG: NAD+ synthase [Verrucomicrobia bacterium]|nr:NAD+ synthase [Verrucomicrobiota bacterium]
MKIFAAQINSTIGDLTGNVRKILDAIHRAKQARADIVLFPELTISGYPPEDLLLDASFIDAVQAQLEIIRPATAGLVAIVGLPRWNPRKKEKPLVNSAAVFKNGELIGYKDKELLPTYDVFDERRYFEPGKEPFLFEYLGRKIAVTICEDLWQHSGTVGYTHYSSDPVVQLQELRPDLLLNLSASPYYFERKDARVSVFAAAAKTLRCPVVLCNEVGGNDQLIFDGHSIYINEKGELIQIAKGFVEDDFLVDLDTNACPCAMPKDGIKDLYNALVLGVRDYFHKQGFSKAILGLSGGVDSALVACIAKEALGSENVMGLALPSRFSSPASYADAAHLAKNLNIELKKVEIDSIFQSYLDLLEPFFGGKPFDITEENMQARIRGMILMAFSNKLDYILLNTSNKSELAMGYSTLYGDLCGGFAVINDVTKLQIYHLCQYINRKGELIPEAILRRAPTAELRPNQTDQDTLPPYEELDPLVEDYIERRLPFEEIARKRGVPLEFVRTLARQMHRAEYKRRQAPIGIRVTEKAFTKGRNVPIVQKWI